MGHRVSAKPLFDTLTERGAKQAFADKMNISLSRLMNWEGRGIPHAQVRAVAHHMSLQSADDYYRLAENGTKANIHKLKTIPPSEADKLLALVKSFLDTDNEGQTLILESAKALGRKHGRSKPGRKAGRR